MINFVVEKKNEKKKIKLFDDRKEEIRKGDPVSFRYEHFFDRFEDPIEDYVIGFIDEIKTTRYIKVGGLDSRYRAKRISKPRKYHSRRIYYLQKIPEGALKDLLFITR
jgi:hypothetical protein